MRESKSLKDLNDTKASTEYGKHMDDMIFIKILKDTNQTKNAKYWWLCMEWFLTFLAKKLK